MQAKGSVYSVSVDGKETKVLDLSNASNDTIFQLASGLSQGTHTVAVRLRTEAQHSLTHFRGFRIDGTPGVAPAEGDRRIEFYGNSITRAGTASWIQWLPPFQVQTEKRGPHLRGLGCGLLGRRAAHHLLVGARGDPKTTAVTPNPRQSPDVQASPHLGYVRAGFTRWIPQVVVIDLGTNDYSTASAQPDSTKFFRTYRDFVDTLHARYPQARFVVDGPMMSDNYPSGLKTLTKIRSHLDNVVADVTKRGLKATHLSLTPQEDSRGYGADYHPNRSQAKLNGAELAAHLRQIFARVGQQFHSFLRSRFAPISFVFLPDWPSTTRAKSHGTPRSWTFAVAADGTRLCQLPQQ
ncbi:MAG: hypothetical protein IPN71_00035 [Fibrobacteres bacterium]|nr:hypothetical protein [Fibrobacterota bacterium]